MITRKKFSTYAEYVMGQLERKGHKRKTLDRYQTLLDRINKEIGNKKLVDIRPHHLNSLYSKLSEDGQNKLTSGGLSNKTIREHHNVISKVLSYAEKEMIVTYNAASKADPPKSERPDVTYLQPEEVAAFLNATDKENIMMRSMVYLLVYTGARIGEILGLK